MNRRGALNDRQVKVLRLIAEGKDLSEPEHEGDRITGRALASRGLVTVSKRKGRWSARITDTGRHFLEHGRVPDQPHAQASKPKDDPHSVAGGEEVQQFGENLMQRLLTAPDRLIRVERPEPTMRRLYRRALHAAHSQNLIPDGYLLQHTGRDQGDIIIRLADKAAPDETTWNRIRLNARRVITHPEAVSAALDKSTSWRTVTDAAADDAASLARNLIAEANTAGHALELNTRGRARLILTIRGIAREVHISEEYDNVPHQATPEEIRANRRNPWINKIPQSDSVPSGRLRIVTILGTVRTEWTGLSPATFATRVRRMLHELEAATGEEITQREQERREAAERLSRWRQEQETVERRQQEQEADERRRREAALLEARVRAVAEIRRATFDAAFDAWIQAARMRAFCDELEQLPDADADLAEWVAWGREQADRIDPTKEPTTMATVSFDIEPGPADLQMFLDERRPERQQPLEPSSPSASGSYTNPWHQGLRRDAPS